MTDHANELRRHAAAAHIEEKDQTRSKIKPEFDHLYAETPGIFDLVTIEEFAARMGVSVADVRNDGAMRSSQDAEKQPPRGGDSNAG